MRILIVGYGNPSRQDDGVGWQVIGELRRRWGLAPFDLLAEPGSAGADSVEHGGDTITMIWLQQLDFQLAEELAQTDRLILVDCHVGGEPTAEWDVQPAPFGGPTTHVVLPSSLLELTRVAYGRIPRTTVYSLRGERFEFAEGLSPAVAEHAAKLAERLDARLRAGDA